MKQAEYITRFNDATELKEKRLLVKEFWRYCAEHGTDDVFTQNFLTNHTGALSDGLAKNLARTRSLGASRNFTSSLLARSSMRSLVNIVASEIIPWLIRNDFVFRNYLIETDFQSITIKISADAGGGVQSGGRIQPVIGINPQALINHFHGSSDYASGVIFKKTDSKGVIEWRNSSRD